MDPVSLTGAQTLHPNNEKNVTPEIQYSDAAKKHIMFRRQRMTAARDIRDTTHQEFDDMTFLKWYDVMKKADDQYVAPRKNKTDTAVNTGTIRDKDTSLVEYAMKYDFEPVATVFDGNDDMMEEIAETGEEMVKKSLMLEDFKIKSKLVARSMVAFGTAMVEEAWVERWVLEKQFGATGSFGSIDQTWTQKLVKQYDGCQSKLWDLRKCYFGDIRKFFLNGPQGQPYFFTVEYESYDVVKTLYGDWDRWVNVPTSVVYTPELSTPNVYTSSWTMRPVTMNYCEIVRYYDPVANEFALTINGVDMLPIMDVTTTGDDGAQKFFVSGFPLKKVSPSGAIPFSKFDLEPMHDFAYSKAQPAKMRVFGDLENMFLKLMIRQFKQQVDPTMGNKSGRMFDATVTDPGTVVNDIRDGDLFPILPNYQGPQNNNFSMYELIKKEQDKNSVERSFQGIDPGVADRTATQDLNEMKSSSLKVAAMFDGLIFGFTQLFWLRTANISANWTKPIDVEIDVFNKTIEQKYRTITVPTEGENGQKAKKKIVFTKKTPVRPYGKPTLEDSQDVHQEELDAEKAGGGSVRHAYVHPELLATMKLNWFYSCIPVINETDPLSYMIFAKQINDAITFFGPDSLQVNKLKHRFAKLTGNDFDTWFISQQQLDQKQQAAASANANAAGGASGGAPGANTPGGMPSIATAAKGAVPQLAMK